jgi:hypothetical protein
MVKKLVTGAAVNNVGITLFFADGNTEVLPQASFRTADIVEAIMPKIAKGETAEIELGDFSIGRQIEELTHGAVTVAANDSNKVQVGNHTVDADALQMHVDRAYADGAKGFKRFLEKFKEIKRQHTIDELTKFMKNADLPIADDGSIIGFKILAQVDEDTMVDHHSKKVRQHVGSLVYMPDSKVDDNRRVACSTGLHIASRPYLKGFWYANSRLCLVKIQPKDVIAVPLNEDTKMRVAAYHIAARFSEQDGIDIAYHSQSIHDIPSALQLLSEVVAGQHAPISETVQVTGLGQIEVKKVEVKADRVQRKKQKPVKKITKTSNSPKDAVKAAKIDPKDVRMLKKLIANRPHLADLDPKYLKKLVKAQRMLNDGGSLRQISDKLKLDRDALSRNLIRKAA